MLLSFGHQKVKRQDLEITVAVIELFRVLYGMLHRLVGTIRCILDLKTLISCARCQIEMVGLLATISRTEYPN